MCLSGSHREEDLVLHPFCRQTQGEMMCLLFILFSPLETRKNRDHTKKTGASYPSALAKGKFCFPRM